MTGTRTESSTIVDMLRNRAAKQPDRLCFAYLGDGETESSRLTYALLDTRARELAGRLLDASVVPGDRVLVQCNRPLDFISALFGCFYAGAVAVPMSTPRIGRHLERSELLIANAQPAASLTTSDYRDALDARIAEGRSSMRSIAVDAPAGRLPDDSELPSADEQSVAYLQYTSGSTSVPKGVMIDHGNLRSNSRDLVEALRFSPDSCVVSWLPLFHDMGLFHGCFVPIFAGFPCYLLEPAIFLRYPLRWLGAAEAYGATHLAAPNFAIDLCTSAIGSTPEPPKLDLGRVLCFGVGSEPVRAQTLRDFGSRFAPFGFGSDRFAPGYGLAEASLMVSVRPPGTEPTVRYLDRDALRRGEIREIEAGSSASDSFVSNGFTPPGTSVAVVDPSTMRPSDEGCVGEIWVRGPSVSRGYWRADAVSAETFGAVLSEWNDGPYLRTGDLGFIRNGELFITGRLKDVIIIRGLNHYPHDLELTAERSDDAFQPGGACAFAVEIRGEERVAIVQEVRRTHLRQDPAAMFRRLRRAITESHELQVYAICLVKQGNVPRTSSGKKERAACRDLFLRGELAKVAAWTFEETPPEGAPDAMPKPGDARGLRAGILERAARLLGIASVEVNCAAPLADYGFDSLTAIRLATDVSKWLGRDLSPTLFYDHPSIDRLCDYLAGSRAVAALASTSRVEEPIAIVGMACRFPGAANVEAFRRMLLAGTHAIRPMPPARRAMLADVRDDSDGVLLTGGFLDAVDEFDPLFFGISPREAAWIDPHQRLILEVAWEALEDAAIPPDSLAGAEVGVFVGISSMEYLQIIRAKSKLEGYAGTGNALSIAANRLSYVLDLRGPSLSVDTACSSSLVAVHQACEVLRSGRAEAALAGGVQLILSADTSRVLSQAKMLSPGGRCRTFDVAADGYVRGEGCGVVVLKTLSNAMAAGDRIHAVIRGTGTNQDGRSNGLTAPNGPAQETLLRQVVQSAGVEPGRIGFIEAHGTGTPLGDPIEVGALTAVYGATPGSPCYLGAVKTNIGHLEAAAGIAGLIKTVVALEAGEVPANQNFSSLNPEIRLDNSRFRIPAARLKWDAPDGSRLAAVSSFGFGGTNCHAILQEAPPDRDESRTSGRPSILTLSAVHADALQEMAEAYRAHITTLPAMESAADVCYTTNVGRKHFEYRLAVAGETHSDIAAALNKWRTGTQPRHLSRNPVRRTPKIACLFSGLDAPYRDMGRHLYETETVFRKAIARCDEIARATAGLALVEHLYGGAGNHEGAPSPELAQSLLFAIQFGLGRMWAAWGVTPWAVLGHSLGDVAAACEAGVFGLEDALRLAIARGRSMRLAPGGWAVAVVSLDEMEASRAIGATNGELEIAAVHAPRSVVVSGDARALGRWREELASRGVDVTQLEISNEFHPRLTEPAAEELREVAGSIRYCRPSVKFASTVTGGMVGEDEISSAEYWLRQPGLPVRCVDAFRTLTADGCDALLEIGPANVLTQVARATLPSVRDGETDALASMERERPPWTTLLESTGRLYVRGAALDWRGVNAARQCVRVALPSYPFSRKRYWVADSDSPAAIAGNVVAGKAEGVEAAVLRRVATASNREAIFESAISAKEMRYLAEHRIAGQPWLPAAWAVMAMVNAGQACSGGGTVCLQDFHLEQALRFAEDATTILQVIVETDALPRLHCKLCSRDSTAAAWTTHAMAWLQTGVSATRASSAPVDIECGQVLSVDELYDRLRDRGIDYGANFRTIQEIAAAGRQAVSRVQPTDDAVDVDGCVLHPLLLDGCFQTVAALLPPEHTDSVYLPTGMDALTIFRPASRSVRCHARLLDMDAMRLRTSLTLLDDDGALIATVEVFTCTRQAAPASAARATTRTREEIYESVYEVKWQPSPLPGDSSISAAAAAQRVQACWRSEPEHMLLAAHLDAAKELERLASLRAWDALRELMRSGDESVFTIDALVGAAEIPPRFHALLARMLEILTGAGMLHLTPEGYCPSPGAASADGADELAAMLAAHKGVGAELVLLERCAAGLADILRGRRDALALLFPDGDTSLLTRLYRNSPAARALNAGMAAALMGILESKTGASPLRILEIGGGTGGTTAGLLELLDGRRVTYTFTDISPHFLAKAKQEFAAFHFVDYGLFDVERAPCEQGIAEASYDVVIASNVLHATVDLRESLAHAHSLLAAGGALLVLEGTRPDPVLDLTFGLTEGWWRFKDRGLRGGYPLLSTDIWKSVLTAAGFAQVEVVTPSDATTGRDLGHSALIAIRAPSERESGKGSWLVLTERAAGGEAIVEDLRSAGAVAIIAERDGDFCWTGAESCTLDMSDESNMSRLVAEATKTHGALRGVVYACAERSNPEAEEDIADIAGQRALTLLGMLRTLAESCASNPPRLWVVTRAAQSGSSQDPLAGLASTTLWGMARVAAREYPELRCTCIDLDAGGIEGERQQLLNELLADSPENNVALREDGRGVARLTRKMSGAPQLKIPETESYILQASPDGRLDTMRLAGAERRPPGASQVEIRVEATALNFKDLLTALASTVDAGGAPLGSECGGVVTRVGESVTDLNPGDRVVALADGAFSRYVTVPRALCGHVPDRMPLADAVCLPANFLTATLALERIGSIGAGESVLIHAAAGGTGSAAVQVARRAGARVLATAKPWKVAYLRRLGVDWVGSSRDARFAPEALKATGGRGVDVVLNSLSGELIGHSFAALRERGRFLEIGRPGPLQVKAAALRKDVEYHAIDLDDTARHHPERIQEMLSGILDAANQGVYAIPPRQVFPIEESIEAFRHLQQAQHIGKLVIDHSAVSNVQLNPSGTYLVTGGLGGLGRRVGVWLAERGAGTVVLLGRGPETAECRTELEQMRAAGARVRVVAADVTREDALRNVLDDIMRSPHPLRGVVHAAGVLDDSMLVGLTPAMLTRVLHPKVDGAWNLHRLTRHLALDAFVLFSSAASVLGSSGQANHAAANAFLDGLATYRRARGLPGLSIQWSVWSEIGAAVRKGADRSATEYGLGTIAPADGIRALELLWHSARPVVAVIPADWAMFATKTGGVASPILTGICQAGERMQRLDRKILSELETAPPGRRMDILRAYLRDGVARVLGLDDASAVVDSLGFFELGMDSLTSMELRNELLRQFGAQLPTTLTFDYPTVADLADYLAREAIALEFATLTTSNGRPNASLSHLSDAEVEAELDAELGSTAGERFAI